MGRKVTTIIMEGDQEDLEVRIHRRGKRIIISTDRETVARAMERQVIDAMTPKDEEEPEQAIGFRMED